MYKKPLRPNELFHHGVTGQKWGVRNGPPYPIEDKVLAKGTRLNTVVGMFNPSKHPMEFQLTVNQENFLNRYVTDRFLKNASETGRWVYTYRPDNKHDTKVYEGPFAKYLVMGRGAEVVARHEMETIKDLKMPNKKERLDEFSNLIQSKKHGKQVRKDLKDVRDILVRQQIGSEKERKEYASFNPDKFDPTDKEQLGVAYSIFSHAMENTSRFKSTTEYAKNMSKKYDAMIDDNNQGTYNNAQDPIIIFRANEALKRVGDKTTGTPLSYDEIQGAYEYIKDELAKEGKNVKL